MVELALEGVGIGPLSIARFATQPTSCCRSVHSHDPVALVTPVGSVSYLQACGQCAKELKRQ